MPLTCFLITLKMSKTIVRLAAIVLLILIPKVISAQKKEAKNPNFTNSTSDTCSVACNLFDKNRGLLVATENINFQGITNNAVCFQSPVGFEPGCLLNFNNQSWFLVRILNGKNLSFQINNSNITDIDAAIWGPIAEQDLDNSCQALSLFPKDCDYSAQAPILHLDDANTGEYYLLLITNFDNLPTEIQIEQPSGGNVVYSYFCPEQIQLNSSISSNQYMSALNELELSTNLGDSIRFKAFSGNTIELLPGFSTEDNVVFEAGIETCLNVSQNYTAPTSNITCESYQNHTYNIPHLYANKLTNEYVGTVYSKTQPEVLTNLQPWNDMVKIGKEKDSDRYLWAYRQTYVSPFKVYLRTQEGCPTNSDVRMTEIFNYMGREDTSLPNIAPVTNVAHINTPFHVSCDLKINNTTYPTYSMYLKDSLPNLRYRINGVGWKFNAIQGPIFEEFSGRYFNVTKLPEFTSGKDFYLDLSIDGGVSIDRYLVTRNSCGGHFGVTTVFCRLADSTVFVHTFQGDINTPMKLGNYESGEFGNGFYLGQMQPGEYTMPLTSTKGEYVLDPEIFIRVRYQ